MFQWSCMENAHKIGCHLQKRLGAIYRQNWAPSTEKGGCHLQKRLGAIYRKEWVPSTYKIGCHLQKRVGAIYRKEWVLSTEKSGCHLQTRLGAIYRQDWVPSTDKSGCHLQTWYTNKHMFNAQWLTTITVIFKTKPLWDICNAAVSVQIAQGHILRVAENSGTDKSWEQN